MLAFCCRKNHMKCTIRSQKAQDGGYQCIEGEQGIVPCKGTTIVVRKGGLTEEGRIAENGIEEISGSVIADVGLHHFDAVGKRAVSHILTGLRCGLSVYLHRNDPSLGNPLGCHQGHQSRPCAYVQKAPTALYPCPCPQKDTIGAHLHSTAIVPDLEVTETETGFTHACKGSENLVSARPRHLII